MIASGKAMDSSPPQQPALAVAEERFQVSILRIQENRFVEDGRKPSIEICTGPQTSPRTAS